MPWVYDSAASWKFDWTFRVHQNRKVNWAHAGFFSHNLRLSTYVFSVLTDCSIFSKRSLIGLYKLQYHPNASMNVNNGTPIHGAFEKCIRCRRPWVINFNSPWHEGDSCRAIRHYHESVPKFDSDHWADDENLTILKSKTHAKRLGEYSGPFLDDQTSSFTIPFLSSMAVSLRRSSGGIPCVSWSPARQHQVQGIYNQGQWSYGTPYWNVVMPSSRNQPSRPV